MELLFLYLFMISFVYYYLFFISSVSSFLSDLNSEIKQVDVARYPQNSNYQE